MKIKTIVTNQLDENCYILSSENEAAVIDPGGNAEEIIAALEGLSARYILLTHGHFDHIMAAQAVRAASHAKVVVSAPDSAMLSDSSDSAAARFGFSHDKVTHDIIAADGDILPLGALQIKVLSTPGHTKGGLCFLAGNVLFSGDTLFRETIGNFDFKDRDDMISSIKRLIGLPDETVVYPGHYGPTTIAHEKENNSYAKFNWEWI